MDGDIYIYFKSTIWVKIQQVLTRPWGLSWDRASDRLQTAVSFVRSLESCRGLLKITWRRRLEGKIPRPGAALPPPPQAGWSEVP